MDLNTYRLRKAAKKQLKETRYLLKTTRKALAGKTEVLRQITEAMDAVQEALKKKDQASLPKLTARLEQLVELHLLPHRPNQLWETIKALLIAVSVALFIRWMFIEPFRIPSGSMNPTLLHGDQLMVNKLVYGPNIPFTTKKLYMPRAPRRGEVIVFRFPKDPGEDYIKRVVGLPGDTIEYINRRLYINGQPVEEVYQGAYTGPTDDNLEFDLYLEQLGDVNHQVLHLHRNNSFLAAASDFGPVVVPEGHLFAMGDNRDRSSDSRAWGFVPFSHLKGKAMFIHLPLDPQRHYLPRWERFFQWIK